MIKSKFQYFTKTISSHKSVIIIFIIGFAITISTVYSSFISTNILRITQTNDSLRNVLSDCQMEQNYENFDNVSLNSFVNHENLLENKYSVSNLNLGEEIFHISKDVILNWTFLNTTDYKAPFFNQNLNIWALNTLDFFQESRFSQSFEFDTSFTTLNENQVIVSSQWAKKNNLSRGDKLSIAAVYQHIESIVVDDHIETRLINETKEITNLTIHSIFNLTNRLENKYNFKGILENPIFQIFPQNIGLDIIIDFTAFETFLNELTYIPLNEQIITTHFLINHNLFSFHTSNIQSELITLETSFHTQFQINFYYSYLYFTLQNIQEDIADFRVNIMRISLFNSLMALIILFLFYFTFGYSRKRDMIIYKKIGGRRKDFLVFLFLEILIISIGALFLGFCIGCGISPIILNQLGISYGTNTFLQGIYQISGANILLMISLLLCMNLLYIVKNLIEFNKIQSSIDNEEQLSFSGRKRLKWSASLTIIGFFSMLAHILGYDDLSFISIALAPFQALGMIYEIIFIIGIIGMFFTLYHKISQKFGNNNLISHKNFYLIKSNFESQPIIAFTIILTITLGLSLTIPNFIMYTSQTTGEKADINWNIGADVKIRYSDIFESREQIQAFKSNLSNKYNTSLIASQIIFQSEIQGYQNLDYSDRICKIVVLNISHFQNVLNSECKEKFVYMNKNIEINQSYSPHGVIATKEWCNTFGFSENSTFTLNLYNNYNTQENEFQISNQIEKIPGDISGEIIIDYSFFSNTNFSIKSQGISYVNFLINTEDKNIEEIQTINNAIYTQDLNIISIDDRQLALDVITQFSFERMELALFKIAVIFNLNLWLLFGFSFLLFTWIYFQQTVKADIIYISRGIPGKKCNRVHIFELIIFICLSVILSSFSFLFGNVNLHLYQNRFSNNKSIFTIPWNVVLVLYLGMISFSILIVTLLSTLFNKYKLRKSSDLMKITKII